MEPQDIDSFFLPGGILDTDDSSGQLDLGLSSILGSGRRRGGTSRLFNAEEEEQEGQAEHSGQGGGGGGGGGGGRGPASPKRTEEDVSRMSSIAGINPMAKEFTPTVPGAGGDELEGEGGYGGGGSFNADGVYNGGE